MQTEQVRDTETVGLLALQAEILESIAIARPRDTVLDQLCLLSEKIVSKCIATVMLYNSSRTYLTVVSAPGLTSEAIESLDGTVPGVGSGSCANSVLVGKPTYVCDVLIDDKWRKVRHIAKKLNIGACWSFPIYVNGEVIGSFAITSFERREPSPLNEKLLQTAAHLAGIAIERSINDETLNHSNTAFSNTSEAILVSNINGVVFRSNKAYHKISGFDVEDVQAFNIFESLFSNIKLIRTVKSSLDKKGTWRGEIEARKKSGDSFPALLNINVVNDNQGHACQYVAVLSDISLLKESEKKLVFLAHHDTLTGLPNRFAFEKILRYTLKIECTRDTPLAILFIDLDNFKTINDTRGHAVGDEFLKQVANRLSTCIRNDDVVARVGGDEFTVMCMYKEMDDLQSTAQRILNEISKIYYVDGNDYYSSASIGIALAPLDGVTIQTLIKCADTAMYRAKKLGRDQFCFYTKQLTSTLTTRMEMEVCLRQAIAKNELYIEYQPLYDRSGKIVSIEALLRWRSDKFGVVPPEIFIELAEETGLIVNIGHWVLENSCKEILSCINDFPNLKMCVNLSRFQLKEFFINSLSSILKSTGFDPCKLEFEITESTMLQDFKRNKELLLKVNEMGINLSIDDFGTGYSSLSDLKNLPVQTLKIDKSLIDDLPGDAAISNAVVAMGSALGLTVVAEGVENEVQLDLLKNSGCDYFQGFLFSMPLSLEQLTQELRSSAR